MDWDLWKCTQRLLVTIHIIPWYSIESVQCFSICTDMLFILLERSFIMKITVVVFINLEICFSILKHLWDTVSLYGSCWTSTLLRWFEWKMPIRGLCGLTFASQVELFGGLLNLSAGRPNWRKCITEASLNDGEPHSTS